MLVSALGGKVHVAWPRTFEPHIRETMCGKYVWSYWVEVLPGPVSESRACGHAACQRALRGYPGMGLLRDGLAS